MRPSHGLVCGILALGALIASCNPFAPDPDGKLKPATEETVVGTWRNAEPLDTTVKTEPGPEDTLIRMTLRLDTNHTMVWAQRLAKRVSDSKDREFSRENFTWAVVDSALQAVKTTCQYGDISDSTSKLADAPCQAPDTLTIPIVVSGNVWQVVVASRTMVFRKD